MRTRPTPSTASSTCSTAPWPSPPRCGPSPGPATSCSTRGDDEIARLHAAGKLTELPGIGPTTGKVIAEALDGEVPGYLAKLEDETVIPVGEGADAAGGAAGRLPHPLDLVRRRRADREDGPHRHRPRPRVHGAHRPLAPPHRRPRPQPPSGCGTSSTRWPSSTSELAPFRILTGIEVDILEDGALDQGDDLLARLDVVVASVHSKLRMERREMTRRMVHGRRQPPRRHPRPLHRPQGGRAGAARRRRSTPRSCSPPAPSSTPPSRSTAGPSARTRPTSCSTLALDWGCASPIDTDAHAPGQLEWQAYGCDKAARHGIEPDRIVNTMAADDLVAWAAGHMD